MTQDPRPGSPSYGALETVIAGITPEKTGEDMMSLVRRLFPICRSITGNGVRETLEILREVTALDVHEVPTGYRAFDWTVPREWNIRDAYVKNSRGERVIDFKASNLHVVSYSVPVRTTMTLAELKPHLYAREDLPEAIPYLTSYYTERWGFCLSWNRLSQLEDDRYEVLIDSSLTDGHLTYADAVVPGRTSREVLLSTYVCHPSMANNELSGPVVVAFLKRMLEGLSLNYTYRFVFAPETIGALVYLSKHGDHLRTNLDAGFVATCVGLGGPFTFMRSRRGDTLADRAAAQVIAHFGPVSDNRVIGFSPDGSDERQYCSPGFNLPVGSLMRGVYGSYPQYHTSLDDVSLMSASGLAESLVAYLRLIEVMEMNQTYVNLSPFGEPQLGRRGLYPTLGAQHLMADSLRRLLYLLNYSDGSHDLIDIAGKAAQPVWDFGPEVGRLGAAGLLRVRDGAHQ